MSGFVVLHQSSGLFPSRLMGGPYYCSLGGGASRCRPYILVLVVIFFLLESPVHGNRVELVDAIESKLVGMLLLLDARDEFAQSGKLFAIARDTRMTTVCLQQQQQQQQSPYVREEVTKREKVGEF
jgi:hypothetical protein